MNLFLILFAVAMLAFAFISFSKEKKMKKEVDSLHSTNKSLNEEMASLKEDLNAVRVENDKLSVYKGIMNIDEEANRILCNAKEEADRMIHEAGRYAVETKEKADIEGRQITEDIRNALKNELEQTAQLKRENKEMIQKAKNDAEQLRQEANKQYSYIISEAEKKAEEIAGEAYDIAQNAKRYQDIVRAMRNVIEGYGDRYLMPVLSLLDEMAEEFGYDEAGINLKNARERSRSMMKNNQAASCDYVEQNRRDTAINFVVDAFNGKVDTILSMIKHDNYGTLNQKILDAYSLVNHLGQAFRNARINQEYLDARLDELKWGCMVFELKVQEREEQRRIREQMREEEKARREYEKAMKDAAKEEDLIRKAMEKAEIAISKANEEQKAKYEAQLEDLKNKLKEAEEKNQRALSMAQQTKSGHVYVISNVGSFGENVYKIGMTRRLEPLDRVRELGDASVPFPFDVHAMIYSDDAPSLETELHKFFVNQQMNKVNPRKEFFRIGLADIRKEIESRKIETKWTMAAEAAEYRETIAIEKAMASGKQSNEDWIARQDKMRLAMVDDE